MAEIENLIELLFFDTFSHDINEELNLDLVQFPQPVYITEVRIIPLGARVQADFPGGVRLGATNPSKFHIELFVNDLAKPGASAFERLGDFEYNQNDCINLQCATSDALNEHIRQIPTDGLVLRGCYTTITLAVYGQLAKDSIGDRPSSPPAPVVQISTPTTPIAAIAHVPSEALDIKSKAIPTEVDWSTNDSNEAKIYEPYQKEGVVHYGGKGIVVRNEESLRQSNDGDAKNQPYVESWSSPSNANSNRTKSPDNESWDCNDVPTGKQTSCIASPPRSLRRSRSPVGDHSLRRPSSKREWSKSPEYRHSSRRRSYDRGVLDKKLMKSREYESASHRSPQGRPPRTPSPETPPSMNVRRPPRTPERRLSEEFVKHKVQSPQSTSDDVPANNTGVAPIPDDDTMSQGEPFEPILSDEEMGDDSIDQYELDYEDEDDTSMDFNFKQFNPFVDELLAYTTNCELSENAKELISLATKCLNRAKIRDIECTSKSFIDYQTSEMRENWVHATEQLLQIVNLIQNSSNLTNNKSRQVIKTVIETNTIKLIDWVRIGLDFECANSHQQPGYKIRHIKCGVRLVEILGADEHFLRCLITDENFDIFQCLFALYEQRHMALSIKLMICKAIYACLDTKFGVEFFISENNADVTRQNGYHTLLTALQRNPLTRIKFALKSILKKINLYESLQSIRDIVTKYFVLQTRGDDHGTCHENQYLLRKCLDEVYAAYTWDAQSYSQPKRFLPVAAKFDNLTDAAAAKQTVNSFILYFRIHALLESLLLIVTNRNRQIIGEEVFDSTLNLIEALCCSDPGLEYLKSNIETTNVLAKCLLQVQPREAIDTDDLITTEGIGTTNEFDEDTRMHHLGIEISYKIKTKYCLDAIADVTATTGQREEQLFNLLQTLYNMATFNTQLIRNHVTNTIAMDAQILALIKQVEIEKKLITTAVVPLDTSANAGIVNGVPAALKVKETKTPILCYAIDLIDLTIRNVSTNLDYLRDHGQIIVNLAKMHEQFETDLANILQELTLYLKPLEIPIPFSYDNITPLCDIARRNLEFVTTFPGELTTALRIIRYLAIPDVTFDPAAKDDLIPISNIQNKFIFEGDQRRIELKHKFVILQFYSADGISMCLSILEKLTTYFAQPAVHSAILSSVQGVAAIHILLPTIELLRRMISYVVEARNTEYKDLTAIELLLKTYTLMSHIPSQSLIVIDASYIQNEIVQTLMAYTQPTLIDCVDTESIHKSLWTQMIAELCKYTLTGPYTFMAGLMVFINLLPVPLPIPTNRPLSSNEVSRLITQRQLWSAHLHPNSLLINDLIQALCVSSYTPLLDELSRLILQLADLAPNMGIVCINAVIDVLPIDAANQMDTATGKFMRSAPHSHEVAPQTGIPSTVTAAAAAAAGTTAAATTTTTASDESIQTMATALSKTKRVLGFLSNILCFPCVKVAFISVFHGKVYEFLLRNLTAKPISNDAAILPIIRQTQEHILNIFHTLLNADINLVGINDASVTSDVRVSCALPHKECISGITTTILDYFLALDGDDAVAPIACQFSALKALLILTDHDYTTYNLRNLMERNKEKVYQKLNNMIKANREEDYEILSTFLIYLHSLARKDNIKTERNTYVNECDLSSILNYRQIQHTDESGEKPIHPLLTLEIQLNTNLLDTDISDDIRVQIEDVQFNLKNVLNLLEESIGNPIARELMQDSSEPPFAQSEGIVHQYSIRPIYTLSKYLNGPMSAEQLTTSYWCSRSSPSRLDDPVDIVEPTFDTMPCDLLEVVKTCLPSETNLTSDCKRLLHLSASPQSNRDRTTTAPCFRTRRVEVEPMTGRPEKKLYVSRGRPYARSTASRSDLFRSRPPNTSRPPSLHVDDFLALETCGAQPTGPTGYNKLAREIISIRGTRGRGRSGFDRSRLGLSVSGNSYRQSLRRNSPSTWSSHDNNSSQHFRTATAEPVISSHFQSEYSSSKHFSARSRARNTLRPPRNIHR